MTNIDYQATHAFRMGIERGADIGYDEGWKAGHKRGRLVGAGQMALLFAAGQALAAIIIFGFVL